MKGRRNVLRLVGAALLVAYCLSFGGRWHFMLDNLSSFKVQFSLAFLVLVFLMYLAKEKLWLGIATLGLIVCLAQLAPWYVPFRPTTATADDQGIRIISSNVLSRVAIGRKLAELVRKESPDLVGVVELTPGVVEALSPLRESYPHHFEVPDNGTGGVGLYSRLPIADARILDLGDEQRPFISATLISDQGRIEVLVVHPYAPMFSGWANQRNQQLQLLAKYIRDSGQPTVVMGDLNIAMWSPYYKDLVSVAGLRNAREGRGIGGTWPAMFGLAVPIDHVLATSEMQLTSFRVLPAIGSDHFPIAAQVTLPKES